MPISFSAFADELEKIAASPAAIGAGLGAGLSGLRSGLHEWDQRSHENRSKITPKVQADRTHRIKRMGVDAALSATAGGALAHGGAKLYGKGLDAAGKKARSVSRHAGKLLGKALDTSLDKRFSGESAREIGREIGEGLQGKTKQLGEGIVAGVKEKMTPKTPKLLKSLMSRFKR